MTAHDTDDDTPDKSSGTTRRAILGTAGGLAALAAAGTSTATGTSRGNRGDLDVTQNDEYGTFKGELPDRTGYRSHLNVYERGDQDTTISVTGWGYNGKADSHVGLSIEMDHADLSMYIDPEKARTVAWDLLAAADHAEGHDGD
jgi:hypothetical protein